MGFGAGGDSGNGTVCGSGSDSIRFAMGVMLGIAFSCSILTTLLLFPFDPSALNVWATLFVVNWDGKGPKQPIRGSPLCGPLTFGLRVNGIVTYVSVTWHKGSRIPFCINVFML